MPELPVETLAPLQGRPRALRVRRARPDHRSRRRALLRGVRRALEGREGLGELDHERAVRPHEGRRRHQRRSRCGPVHIAELIKLVQAGTLNVRGAREVLAKQYEDPRPAAEIIQELGLVQVSDRSELVAIMKRALDANPKAVADLKAGKEKAAGAILGFVMRETKGRANPRAAERDPGGAAEGRLRPRTAPAGSHAPRGRVRRGSARLLPGLVAD